MSDIISIEVDGQEYSGWTELSMRRSIEALCGSFEFSSMNRWAINGERWELFPGSECRIRIGDEELAHAYIDGVSVDISGDNHILKVSGRDKTADLVDCSAPSSPSSYRNMDLLTLAKELCRPFGISVSASSAGPKFSVFRVQSGETVFEALNKAAKRRAMLLTTGRVGNLVITNTGSTRAHDSLVIGDNVLRATGIYDYANRYGAYMIKSADRTVGKGWNAQTISIFAEATDDDIFRHRPLIIRGDGVQTTKDAQNQVRWEAWMRAAKAVRASAVVRGMRQSNGSLWEVNTLVWVDFPQMLIAGDMLISSIEYQQNSGGTLTTMELTRPDAYAAEPAPVVKSSPSYGWDKKGTASSLGSINDEPD